MLRGRLRSRVVRELPRRREDLSSKLVVLFCAVAACHRGGGADCYAVMDFQVCDGTVEARRAERPAAGGPWRCEAATCEERQPRQPDDGTWECADLDGAVVCHGGGPPAGVVVGPPDVGWSCGARRGVANDKVCVDLSPDFPSGDARGWRCAFTHDHGERRVCRRDESAPAIGAPCEEARGCKAGDRCVDRRCVPPRPQPSCWIDKDCGASKCVRGSCV